MVYDFVSLIPRGKVTTYGNLARLSGIKNPRVVGNLLHKNPNPKTNPCHRVVNAKGKVAENYAFGGEIAQIKKLQSEGVPISNGKVDLGKYLWLKN